MTMRNPRRWRHRLSVATAAGVAVVALASCSASTSTNANYVAVDPAPAPATADAETSANASTPAAVDSGGDPVADARGVIQGLPVPATTIDQISATWDQFLSERAAVVAADNDTGDLDAVATPGALEQVNELRVENQRRVAADELVGLVELIEWGNIDRIVADPSGDRVQFIDCTERHRVNVLGRSSVVFATNVVEAVAQDGSWKIDRVDQIQNGVIGLTADDLGCVPASFAQRAMETATEAVDLAAGFASDPGTVGDLPELFQGDARDTLTAALTQLDAQGLRRSPNERIRIDVIGMDLNRPDFTVVVEVCRYYPDGRSYLGAGDIPTAPDTAPGSSEADRLLLLLEPTAGESARDAVVDISSGDTGCWEDA